VGAVVVVLGVVDRLWRTGREREMALGVVEGCWGRVSGVSTVR
jgi:hypothetical protein